MFRIIFILSIAFLMACKGGHPADYEVQVELQLIDTLKGKIETVRGWMEKMPLNEIQERLDVINNNSDYIIHQLREQGLQADEQMSKTMDDYKAFKKLYSVCADSFKPIVTEAEELFYQLKTLKESAYTKDYQKDTFLMYFHKEKADVEQLYQLASSILKPAVDTDLDFERTEAEVEAIAQELKENSGALKEEE